MRSVPAEGLKQAHDAKDTTTLVEALGQVAALHNRIEDKTWRARLRVGAGDVLDAADLAAAHQAALDALVALDDPRAAFAQMQEHLPATKDPDLTLLQRRVLATLGRSPVDAAISALKELASKASGSEVQRAAILTLGNYTSSPARGRVLAFLLKSLADLSLGPNEVLQGPWLTAWQRTGPALIDALLHPNLIIKNRAGGNIP